MQVPALGTRNSKVPDSFMRVALHIESNDNSGVGCSLDEANDHATPPEDALCSRAFRHEESTPFDEDSDFEKWKNEGVADSKDENPLVYVSCFIYLVWMKGYSHSSWELHP
jgi:hypothetical protein